MVDTQKDLILEPWQRGYRGYFQAMASPCELIVDAGSRDESWRLLKLAATEVWRIEAKYSRYRNDNLLSQINCSRGNPIRLDEESVRLFHFAEQCYQISEGLFDITSGALGKVWKFNGSAYLPAQQEIDTILDSIGWNRVQFTPPYIRLPEGVILDLGGIGKEYAVDRTLGLLQQQSEKAILLNLGGDLRVSGPRHEGKGWHIGLEAINSAHQSGAITIHGGALATSGDSKRFIEVNGERYGHILNPKSGWPVVGAPRSVTVFAPSALQAGMLSTMAMLQGEGAEVFLKDQQLQRAIVQR